MAEPTHQKRHPDPHTHKTETDTQTRGPMNITEQRQTYEHFIKLTKYSTVGTVGILILLAIVLL